MAIKKFNPKHTEKNGTDSYFRPPCYYDANFCQNHRLNNFFKFPLKRFIMVQSIGSYSTLHAMEDTPQILIQENCLMTLSL